MCSVDVCCCIGRYSFYYPYFIFVVFTLHVGFVFVLLVLSNRLLSSSQHKTVFVYAYIGRCLSKTETRNQTKKWYFKRIAHSLCFIFTLNFKMYTPSALSQSVGSYLDILYAICGSKRTNQTAFNENRICEM